MMNELFSDFVQDVGDGLWKKHRVYSELSERGLNNPFNARAHLEAMAESLTTYGKINYKESTSAKTAENPVDYVWNQFKRVAAIGGKSTLAAADIAMALLIRPFLPRAGDMMANIVSANASFSAIHAIESHLRWRYANEKERGRHPRIPDGATIIPVDVLPRWFRMSRSNLTALSDLKNWFQGAGVDLRQKINEFYEQLDAAGDNKDAAANARFLDHESAWNIVQQHLEDVNVATPANRPAIAKRGTFHRILFALQGWRWNMFSKVMDMAGKAMWKHDSGFKNTVDATFNWGYLSVALALGGLGLGWLLEFLTRAVYLAAFGEIRSVRQIGEFAESKGNIQQAAINTASVVPFLDSAINVAFNTQPSKARFSPNVLAQTAALQLMNYAVGVKNTGDFTYGVDRMLIATQPTIGKFIVNQMPSNSGKVEAFNASRLLARYSDDAWLKEGRFTGSPIPAQFVTRYTPYANRMVNYAMQNKLSEVRRTFNDAVMEMVMNEGISYEEAQRRMRLYYTNRNPYSRTFQKKLTDIQRASLYTRMSPREAAMVRLVEQKFARAGDMLEEALEEYFESQQQKLMEKNLFDENAMTNLDFDEFWDDLDI
jgi:hypothetical protein